MTPTSRSRSSARHPVEGFDDAVAFLNDHIDFERLRASAGRIEGLSLDGMRHVVDVLGDPQTAYPVVHLTGTNGKGSTARMISTLLIAHSLSVGTYTSPHLEHITERIAWNLQPIDVEEFARVIGELAALEPLIVEEIAAAGGPRDARLSHFEVLTAAAFSYFAQVAVDVAVVEVGLLGRWDATNVAEAKVAVVTNVGKDHTDGTGDWRRHIAEEKAGIVTPGGELVLGAIDPELLPVFAAEGAAQTWVGEEDFGVEIDEIALGGHLVDIRTPMARYEGVFLPVHGSHQTENAACAIAAVEMLFGRELNADLVREAFSTLRLPGRFEVLHRGPLLVLDSAHNPDGARTTARTLAEEFDIPGRRRWVLGMLTGRDVDEMIEGFGIRPGDQVVACNPDWPRAMPAKDIARAAQSVGADVEVVPSPTEALNFAWRTASVAGEADLVMVTGSHYTVGEARTQCRRLDLLAPEGTPD